MITKIKLLISLLLVMSLAVNAQNDTTVNKNVIVVREYNPTIADAYKINSNPSIEEAETYSEKFNYNVFATPMQTEFILNPLDTPPLRKERTNQTKQSYVRAGLGNYTSFLTDVYYDAFNTQEHNLDFYFLQHSSFGKIKLEDGEKVKAPIHKTQFQTNYYKSYKRSQINTSINYERVGYRNYGFQSINDSTNYTRTFSPDTANILSGTGEKFGKKRDLSYSDFNFKLVYQSIPEKKLHTDYSVGIDFSNFSTKEKTSENSLKVGGHFITPADDVFFGATGELAYYFPKTNNTDTIANDYLFTNQLLAQFGPFVRIEGKTWNLNLGFKAFSLFEKNKDTEFAISPNIMFEFDLIPQVFKAYIKADGDYQPNSIKAITKENPYVSNDLFVIPTIKPLIISGGLDGYFTPTLVFNAEAKFSIIKDQYFFINESYISSTSGFDFSNRFNVLYSDGNILKISGGLNYTGNKTYSAAIQGCYYNYNFDNLSKAWYMPEYTIALSGKYNLTDEIHLSGEATYQGKRYAPIPNASVELLDGMLDLNIMGEYDYTKNISFFGRLHNIAAQNYQRWYGYPSQGFNVLFGGILKF